MFDPVITDNEHRVLRSLVTSGFSIGDGYGGAVWSNCVNDSREPSGIEGKALSGVISSLVKKGWVITDGKGADATIEWATEETAAKAKGLAKAT